jgi:hypothetical protein
MKVISDKEVRVTTTGGTAVIFHPNVEKTVADEIGLLALQMGAKQVDSKEIKEAPAPITIELADEVEASEEVEEGEMDKELLDCLEKLIDEGHPDNFKADGAPKSQVVNKLMGRHVPSDERDAAWEIVLNS